MNKVRYPWASHLQGSCARGKNKIAGSEEFSLVLTAVSPSPGFYIMCVISSSLFLPNKQKAIFLVHLASLTDCFPQIWHICMFPHPALPPLLFLLANGTQKSFHGQLTCIHCSKGRLVHISSESVSYIGELREAAWEPQLLASLLTSPSFIDNVIHYSWEHRQVPLDSAILLTPVY